MVVRTGEGVPQPDPRGGPQAHRPHDDAGRRGAGHGPRRPPLVRWPEVRGPEGGRPDARPPGVSPRPRPAGDPGRVGPTRRTAPPHRRAAGPPRPHGGAGSRRRGRPVAATATPPVATAIRHSTAARRSAVVGVFTVLLAACAVWVQGGGGRTGSGPLAAPGAGRTETAAVHVWIVQPGDTLWGIARRLDPHGDVRPLVDALSRQVHGKPLQAGEQLRLP